MYGLDLQRDVLNLELMREAVGHLREKRIVIAGRAYQMGGESGL
jgi:hypothetical protein